MKEHLRSLEEDLRNFKADLWAFKESGDTGPYSWLVHAILGEFWGTLFSPIGHGRTISRNFWHTLAQNFVAHLSGWVRLWARAMAWAFLASELGYGCQVRKVGKWQKKVKS